MARSVRSGLESRSARLKLRVSSKPVWLTIGPGLGLGYRRNKTAGNWVARSPMARAAIRRRNIGNADDYAEANDAGRSEIFPGAGEGAATRKRQRRRSVGHYRQPGLETVRADIRTRGGDVGNASRLRGHLSPAMLRKPVALLSTAELRRWRDSLVKDLAASTVNRISTVFKAALNHVADQESG